MRCRDLCYDLFQDFFYCIGDDEKSDDKKDDAAEDDASDADTAKEDTADTAKDAE